MQVSKYYLIYKPFGVLSQFTKEGEHLTLADVYSFPKDVYSVGRLDADSEGLLLLTNDKKLNHHLLNPVFAHKRTYFVQVEGDIKETSLKMLSSGVEIKLPNGKVHLTKPASAILLDLASLNNIPERNPPIRFRKDIPTPWISLTLTEGKNRQVRKMTAKVGFPTLRLIRASIEDLHLKLNVKPGDVWEIGQKEVYEKLKIKDA